MVDVFAAIRLVQWFRDAAYKELPKDTGDVMIFRVSRPAKAISRGIGRPAQDQSHDRARHPSARTKGDKDR